MLFFQPTNTSLPSIKKPICYGMQARSAYFRSSYTILPALFFDEKSFPRLNSTANTPNIIALKILIEEKLQYFKPEILEQFNQYGIKFLPCIGMWQVESEDLTLPRHLANLTETKLLALQRKEGILAAQELKQELKDHLSAKNQIKRILDSPYGYFPDYGLLVIPVSICERTSSNKLTKIKLNKSQQTANLIETLAQAIDHSMKLKTGKYYSKQKWFLDALQEDLKNPNYNAHFKEWINQYPQLKNLQLLYSKIFAVTISTLLLKDYRSVFHNEPDRYFMQLFGHPKEKEYEQTLITFPHIAKAIALHILPELLIQPAFHSLEPFLSTVVKNT